MPSAEHDELVLALANGDTKRATELSNKIEGEKPPKKASKAKTKKTS